MLSFLTYAYLLQKKISQIQIGGLQPCDDLTWNDPRTLNYNLLTTMAVRLSLFTNCNAYTMFPFTKNAQKSTVQFHVRREEDFHVSSFLYSITIQPTSLRRKQGINVRPCFKL